MTGVKSAAGYTIVEVMIFLSVTGLLFMAAAFYIAGQQERAYFATATSDAQSQIEDLGNDVGAGYVPVKGEFDCIVSGPGNPPTLRPTPGIPYRQGQNPGCVFLGKVIKFEQDSSSYTVITVAGNSRNSANQEVKSFAEAHPTPVMPGPASAGVDLTETGEFKNGLIMTRVVYQPNRGGPFYDIGAIGIFTTFPQTNPGTQNLISGSQSVMMVPIINSTLSESVADTASRISGVNESDANPHTFMMCFRHGQGGKKVAMALGVGGRRLTSNLVLEGVDITTGLIMDNPGAYSLCP